MPRRKTNDEFVNELKKVNPDVLPLESYHDARTKVRVKCKKCGNVWSPLPNNLLRSEGCPICAGNQKITHEAFVLRVHEINPNILVVSKYENNKTEVKCRCLFCNNEYDAYPSSLLRGHGCRNCVNSQRGKARKKTDEQFRLDMQRKNPLIEIIGKYEDVKSLIDCRCKICGYSFAARPDALLHGKKCDNCRKNHHPLMKSNEDFLAELKDINPNVQPLDKYEGYTRNIRCRCNVCGNTWAPTPDQLLRGQSCRSCQKRYRTSFPEQAVFFYVKRSYPNSINTYREGFGKSELDIYIPDLNTGIEYDGRNWHKQKTDLETKKYNVCRDKGIRLIRIRERSIQECSAKICDDSIITAYGNSKRFSDLDATIKTLCSKLGIQEDIDTQRDQNQIKEQYYQKLKNESFATKFPDIAKEWYQQMNGCITPDMVRPYSNETFYWKCSKCGKVYPAIVSNRAKGSGCPKCACVERKDEKQYFKELQNSFPDILMIDNFHGLDQNVEYFCNSCGKKQSKRARLLLRNGCSNCNRKKGNNKKRLSEEVFLKRVSILYKDIEIIGHYVNSASHIQCKCKRCKETWSPTAGALLSHNTGCKNCANRKKKSVLCVETMKEYEGINDAARHMNISHVGISRCCNGKAITAGGYHWKFTDTDKT